MDHSLPKGYIDKRKESSSDYELLYMEGIELLQKLSGANWTDFNEHDPGITILENIAYALTNLSYKTDLPIKSILQSSKGGPLNSGDNGLFVPSEILTTSPVTILDYRKLFIDNISNFKNVFIRPKKGQTLKGLYEIYVEMYTYDSDPKKLELEKNRIKSEVNQLFHQHRNLCEDLYSISILDPFILDLILTITIDDHIHGEQLYAQIYFEINDYLTHEVKYTSLDELKKQKVPIDAIFNGPSLANGFIKDEELQEMKSDVYLNDILKVISNVEGVISVDSFGMNHVLQDKSTPIRVEIMTLPDAVFPILQAPNNNTSIKFKQEGVEFSPNMDAVNGQIEYLDKMYYGAFNSVSHANNTVKIPNGNTQELASYYPIRKQFPMVYGIGEDGLEKNLPAKRYAQANQLKAYLLPLDQMMANFSAQLNHVFSLYNLDSSSTASYFTQELDDMGELLPLISSEKCEESEDVLQNWTKDLAHLLEEYDQGAVDRLHQIADSLLARYGEEFPTNSLQKIQSSLYGNREKREIFELKTLRWKHELIKNQFNIGYFRGSGLNYMAGAEDAPSKDVRIPGLIQKLGISLGIDDYSLRPLVKLMSKAGVRKFKRKEGREFLTETLSVSKLDDELEVIDIKETLIIESLQEDLRSKFYFIGSSDHLYEDVLRNGLNRNNYKIEPISQSEQKGFHIKFQGDQVPYQVVHITDTHEQALESIETSVTFLTNLNRASEGFYLMEHTLLAPDFYGNYFGFSFAMILGQYNLITFTNATNSTLEVRNNQVTTISNPLENIDSMSFSVAEKEGCFEIHIYFECALIAISTLFQEREAAQKIVTDIKSAIEECKEPYVIENLENEIIYENNRINEEFLSLKLSFVLPSWPGRFQDDNFRGRFENTVYENVPAHLSFHTYYVNVDDMTVFEDTFYKWIKVLALPKQNPKRLKLGFQLLMILKDFNKRFCAG